jgi:hypothetical protein
LGITNGGAPRLSTATLAEPRDSLAVGGRHPVSVVEREEPALVERRAIEGRE